MAEINLSVAELNKKFVAINSIALHQMHENSLFPKWFV